jgi:hypothetical protein
VIVAGRVSKALEEAVAVAGGEAEGEASRPQVATCDRLNVLEPLRRPVERREIVRASAVA